MMRLSSHVDTQAQPEGMVPQQQLSQRCKPLLPAQQPCAEHSCRARPVTELSWHLLTIASRLHQSEVFAHGSERATLGRTSDLEHMHGTRRQVVQDPDMHVCICGGLTLRGKQNEAVWGEGKRNMAGLLWDA